MLLLHALIFSSHAVRMRMQGLLMDDMLPDFDKPITQTHGTATWLGTCRPQGSPHVRRIDIKVFPRWCAPAGPAPVTRCACAQQVAQAEAQCLHIGFPNSQTAL